MLEIPKLLNLDLDGDLFRRLPRREQVEACTLFAERAQNLAAKSPPVQRQLLMNIASQWMYLADFDQQRHRLSDLRLALDGLDKFSSRAPRLTRRKVGQYPFTTRGLKSRVSLAQIARGPLYS
jgi:hypothetical protein